MTNIQTPAVSPTPVAEPSANDRTGESDRRGGWLAPLGFWIEEAPAWLTSGLLHLTALLLLALLAIGAAREDRLILTVGLAEEAGEQLIEEPLDLSANAELEVEEQVLTPDFLPEVPDPLATPPLAMITPVGQAFAADVASVAVGAALSGRTPGRKEALLREFGGTAKTEGAVELGLRWLARQQARDGSWSLRGPYADGARTENREAATAMALLAFQGAGKLPSSSRTDYGREVRKGWNWLLERQTRDGSFFHFGGMNHRYYTHAIATIALCELLAMTEDEQYREPAEKAVHYLIRSQSEMGGWKYEPKVSSDLSVSGWVLMALKSAQMARIEVPTPVYDDFTGFLDEVARSDADAYGGAGSRYVYEVSDVFIRERVPAMTAVGLLCREYLGWALDDRRLTNGIDFMLDEHLPEWRRGKVNVYYWYYATQVLIHAGGSTWTRWNRVMRELLPEEQVRDGRERGSWDSDEDAWGASGGRLYVTCMALYTLEVYYRHLPLYKQQATQGANGAAN